MWKTYHLQIMFLGKPLVFDIYVSLPQDINHRMLTDLNVSICFRQPQITMFHSPPHLRFPGADPLRSALRCDEHHYRAASWKSATQELQPCIPKGGNWQVEWDVHPLACFNEQNKHILILFSIVFPTPSKNPRLCLPTLTQFLSLDSINSKVWGPTGWSPLVKPFMGLMGLKYKYSWPPNPQKTWGINIIYIYGMIWYDDTTYIADLYFQIKSLNLRKVLLELLLQTA